MPGNQTILLQAKANADSNQSQLESRKRHLLIFSIVRGDREHPVNHPKPNGAIRALLWPISKHGATRRDGSTCARLRTDCEIERRETEDSLPVRRRQNGYRLS
jgi:hypothetical protein